MVTYPKEITLINLMCEVFDIRPSVAKEWFEFIQDNADRLDEVDYNQSIIDDIQNEEGVEETYAKGYPSYSEAVGYEIENDNIELNPDDLGQYFKTKSGENIALIAYFSSYGNSPFLFNDGMYRNHYGEVNGLGDYNIVARV